MCATLWSMIPAEYLRQYETLNRQFIILLLATRDWIVDLQARHGLARVAPYDLAYVPTAVHPFSRRSSVDSNIGRRNERIAMNGLVYQMMNWGHSWIEKVGGDVQHQILQTALHYIRLMQQPTIPLDGSGMVKEYD